MRPSPQDHEALNSLGRRLDELARVGADDLVLDGILTAMRHHHDCITHDLAAAAGLTRPRVRRGQRAHLRVA